MVGSLSPASFGRGKSLVRVDSENLIHSVHIERIHGKLTTLSKVNVSGNVCHLCGLATYRSTNRLEVPKQSVILLRGGHIE